MIGRLRACVRMFLNALIPGMMMDQATSGILDKLALAGGATFFEVGEGVLDGADV